MSEVDMSVSLASPQHRLDSGLVHTRDTDMSVFMSVSVHGTDIVTCQCLWVWTVIHIAMSLFGKNCPYDPC